MLSWKETHTSAKRLEGDRDEVKTFLENWKHLSLLLNLGSGTMFVQLPIWPAPTQELGR